jgi:transposase
MRSLINAIFTCCAGCQWRLLPCEFPPAGKRATSCELWFHCWQKAHAMPDGIALFALDLANREDFISVIQAD